MDNYIFKTSISIPFYYDIDKFNDIKENEFIKDNPISITDGKDDNWVNDKAVFLFGEDCLYDSCKEIFIKRFELNSEKYREIGLLKGKQAYYISNMSDHKFKFDNIFIWLMKSGCVFVSYNITVTNTFKIKNNKVTNTLKNVINEEKIAKIIFKLKDKKNEIKYEYVECNKDTQEKKQIIKKVKLLDMAKDILDKAEIIKKDEKEIKCKEPCLAQNYIITDDETSSEARRLLEVIYSKTNPYSTIINDVEKVDDKKFYYEKGRHWLWLCSNETISMIGSTKNDRLIDGNVATSVFNKHLFLCLYYYNIYLVCKFIDNSGINLLKSRWKVVKKMLKAENKTYKKEIEKQVKKDFKNEKNRYLEKKKNRYLGGLASTEKPKIKHLNRVYVYHYATIELELIKKIGECYSKDIVENILSYIKELLLAIPDLIKWFVIEFPKIWTESKCEKKSN